MGTLSRALLSKFVNIPFVRRPFHYFLSDKYRLAWLNRRIHCGQIFQDDPDGPMYPTLARDRAFIFVSRSSYAKHNIWPNVGEEILRIERKKTDKARSHKPTEYSYLANRTPGLAGYQGYKVIGSESWSQADSDSRWFGPMPLTFSSGEVVWQLEPDIFSFDNCDPDNEAKLPSHCTITASGLTLRLKGARQSSGPPANTGPKARLRYSASSTKRQESIGRISSKRI